MESQAIWRGRFESELQKRGGTETARKEMVSETPEWLCQILGFEFVFGQKPIWCTCAQWYMDGTHHAECLHLQKYPQLTPRALDLWESARFTIIFLASGLPCSQAVTQPAHKPVTQDR